MMKKIYYNMQVYNDYVDFPIAMTNIEDFDFDKLLLHPNPKVRMFSFIVISKCTEIENTTTVQPIILIYNKKQWKVRSEYVNNLEKLCSDFRETKRIINKKILKIVIDNIPLFKYNKY